MRRVRTAAPVIEDRLRALHLSISKTAGNDVAAVLNVWAFDAVDIEGVHGLTIW